MNKEAKSEEIPSRSELVIEYQKAQDSAQHYEAMAWTVTSITWAASLVLLGLILRSLAKTPNFITFILIALLSVLGFLLTIAEWWQHRLFQKVKLYKYSRCKEIEEIIGLQQHKHIPSYPKKHRDVFSVFTYVLLFTWVCVIVYLIWIAWAE